MDNVLRIISLALEFADVHMLDNDILGDNARELYDIIGKEYPDIMKQHFSEEGSISHCEREE